MEQIQRLYTWLFDELGDPRIKDWPLMSGPIPLIIILVTYMYTIKVWLPSYMKNRPAYNLKTVIRWYNVLQVAFNALLCWGILTSGWTTTLTLGCELPKYTYEPEEMRMLTWMYYTLYAKILELIETSFFILRKKDSQASFLHIYHHTSTLTVMWLGAKYIGGGMASFTPLINTFIHVIMYSYYLLSAEAGPALRAKLNKWKMWLTILQMVQFTLVFFHSVQTLSPSCKAPRFFVYMFIPNILLIYYLFFDFFKKTYLNKDKKTT